MSYTPLNVAVFTQAFTGALSALVIGGRYINSALAGTYDTAAAAAGKWAQTFDTTWGAAAANTLVLNMVNDESYAAFDGRSSTNPSANFQTEVTAVIASITSATNYFAGQGIIPPSPGAKGADLTNADATITYAQGTWRVLPAATLTADRILTLDSVGAQINGQITITRDDITAFLYTIKDISGTTLFVMSAGNPTSFTAEWTGTFWEARLYGP